MTRPLIAYQLTDTNAGFDLVPASPAREWIGATFNGSRCLPLLMANQAGWHILCPYSVGVKWEGGPGLGTIWFDGPVPEPGESGLISHFGNGIVTWVIPYLFRTPPGYNLLVRGPANAPKDGIAPLEGLVETDWAVGSFTMNWQITRKDTWITFEKGEPVALLVPQRRGELEEFAPEVALIDTNPELCAAVEAWQDSRGKFNEQFVTQGAEAMRGQWEGDYFRGTSPEGTPAPDHQTRLSLRPFRDTTL